MEKKNPFREKVSPIRQWMMMFFAHLYTGNVHYIGGADPLPQPLTPKRKSNWCAACIRTTAPSAPS